MENTNENWLATAVRYLKGKGTIKTIKELAKTTGYSEGALSNMINSSARFQIGK